MGTYTNGRFRQSISFPDMCNSPSYWKLSLAYVKKMMDWGADGVFIDNVGGRRRCFGPKFNVPPGSSATNPEFGPFVHEHLFPDTTESYAWDLMLQTIRDLVKVMEKTKLFFSTPESALPIRKMVIAACGNHLFTAGHGKEDAKHGQM